jgi:hypothetical protein
MAKASQIRPAKKRPKGTNPWFPLLGTMLAATPAVAVGLLGAAAVTLDRMGPPEVNFYRTQAEAAIGRGDLEGYRLCLETINRLDPSNQAAMLNLAQTLEKLDKGDGKKEKASALWAALAPLDKPGFGPAQLEQVTRILKKVAENPPKEADQQQAVQKLLEIHLRQGLTADPGNPDLAIILADQLLAEEKADDALKVLETVPEIVRTPEIKSRLAGINLGKDKFKAQEYIAASGDRLIAQAKAAPTNLRLQRALADTQLVRGDLAGAVVTWALLREKADSQLRQNEASNRLIQVHVERIDQLLKAKDRDFNAIAELIKSGLEVDPRSGPILQRLVKLADFTDASPAAEGADSAKMEAARTGARGRLENMLAKGVAPDLIHLLLAVEYHVARREAQARLHFDLAHRANPKDAGLANNLAWYLANTNPRDPERALVLVNDALTRQPGNASFLETRGQIHAQMGQDRSAIADLEVALGALGSRRAIHNTLAACYEKQGESELAKKHKALAQEAKK